AVPDGHFGAIIPAIDLTREGPRPVDRKLLESINNIYNGAAHSDGGERCMVAPSPDAAKKLKEAFEALKGTMTGPLARTLRLRERRRPGFHDALIYPGKSFPVGTPSRVIRSAAADRAPLHGNLN